MVLIDANIFMYAAGVEHPHKAPSVAFLERVARGEIDAVIDAETLQEILHRYRALKRWPEGQRVYDLARRIVPTVLPITVEVLDSARLVLDRNERVSARDALHAAVVVMYDLRQVCSYDRDFDELEEIQRVEP